MQLENKKLLLTFSTENPSYGLKSLTFPEASLQSGFATTCQVNGEEVDLFDKGWQIESIEDRLRLDTPIGKLQACRLTVNTCVEGVQAFLLLGLSEELDMAFIRMEFLNLSGKDLILHRITPVTVKPGDLRFGNHGRPNPVFYSQGWQSWSSTATYGLGDRQHTSILDKFQNPMVVNSGTPRPKRKNHFTGDMFGILGDRTNRIGLLAGFLSQKEHFGSLETNLKPHPSLRMWANGDETYLPSGNRVRMDWAALGFINLDAPEPMEGYLLAAARENGARADRPVPVGWCSWYHFYQKISQENLQANLDSLIQLRPDLPLPLFQIDDGFEPYPGDWFDFTSAFPDGLMPLVQNANSAGFMPGVWLAPFIVHPKSKLASEYPDWLLRDERGKPVNAGFVWNTFNYALDLTNPDALSYTCYVIRTAVRNWGFRYLKLDFLYAAALQGKYQDPTQSRAQVLRKGLEALREAAGPDVIMLGCGCPLGSGLGVFDAMRISADVNGYWKPHFPPVSPILSNEPHMPSARNALHNVITRAGLHRRWWVNDPDCLLIRPDTKLTLPEVQTLATAIGLTGGSLLLSDDLPALSSDRLRMAQALLPVIDQRALVLDAFDAVTPSRLRVDLDGSCGPWHLLAWFNWTDTPQSFSFSPQAFRLDETRTWWLREFWTGAIGQMGADSPYTFNDIPAHGVRVAAVRPFDSQRASYLGSDLHLSQGMEVSEWQSGEHSLDLHFKLGHSSSGKIFFYLPWQPASVRSNRKMLTPEDKGNGVYSVELGDADGRAVTIE